MNLMIYFPSSAEVKNEWSYASTPPICLCDMVRKTLPFNYFNDGISSSHYMAYNGKITGT